jgi:ketosteroid isomerase-like protein
VVLLTATRLSLTSAQSGRTYWAKLELEDKMKSISTAVITATLCLFAATIARADDVSDVKTAEIAFNAAENAGNIEAMFRLSLPDRTVFGSRGGRLAAGWTDESKKRRQAEFDAGRKIDYRIEDLEVRIFGDVAVTTFYRIGTVKELNEAAKPSHMRISGVWVRQGDGWKLAHRHESNLQ